MAEPAAAAAAAGLAVDSSAHTDFDPSYRGSLAKIQPLPWTPLTSTLLFGTTLQRDATARGPSHSSEQGRLHIHKTGHKMFFRAVQ